LAKGRVRPQPACRLYSRAAGQEAATLLKQPDGHLKCSGRGGRQVSIKPIAIYSITVNTKISRNLVLLQAVVDNRV